ncbi:Signal transduction histidine kinase [Ligilactobacillus sp. WC1T17]|uniref:histidine kinase n=1 Tax=Ligilactobacillus ruminis TaxID=1623 RepID=A0ABY1AAF5_9LACO|nr:Signal transduction histidine kinase [Ligilactobacillus ruminis]
MQNKNRKIQAQNAFLALITLTFVAVLFHAALFLFISKYILQTQNSLAFLQAISHIPCNPVLTFWSAIFLFIFLIFIIYYRQQIHDQKKADIILMGELLVIIAIFLVLKASYSGIIFLVFADIFFSTQNFYAIKSKRYWFFFLTVAFICFMCSNYDFLTLLINLPSIDTYIAFLPLKIRAIVLFWRYFIYALNVVLFILSLFTYVVYVTNEQRNIEEELRMAAKTNDNLNSYIEIAQANAEKKERIRISREIHDTLGHALTGISAGLDAVNVLIDIDKDSAKKQLQNLSVVVREGIVDVRNSLNKMRPGTLDHNSLKDSLKQMLERYTSVSHLQVNFTYNWQDADLEKTTENVIFRLVEESVTNSVRHGHANQIDIIFNQDDNFYYIDIQDDGQGCNSIKAGYGLTQMQERLAIIGGCVTYEGQDGFLTKVKFIKK